MLKAFRYRLCPTKAQEAALNEQLRLCRNPYNSALQERRDACRKAWKTVTEYGQMKYLTEVNARRCLINGADTFKRGKEEVSCTVKLKRHHRKET
jgi:transposase